MNASLSATLVVLCSFICGVTAFGDTSPTVPTPTNSRPTDCARSDVKTQISNACFARTLEAAKQENSPSDTRANQGVVLKRVQKDGLYGRLGLEAGNVIESVNGVPTSDSDRAIQVLNSLKMEDAVNVQIRRNGEVETLSLPPR